MKCSKCNSEVKDNMKFCPKCGTEIPQIHFCSQCGAELKEGMKFCSRCGCSIYDNSAHVDSSDSPMVFTHGSSEISGPFKQQVVQENAERLIKVGKSGMKKWLKLMSWGVAVIFFIGIVGIFSNVFHDSSSSYSNNESGTTDYSNEYADELEKAENELQQASNELNEILPYYLAVIRQYGGGQMAIIAASQNNPQLFRNFDNAESQYERCFEKVASIYDKMGYPESGDAYRDQLRNWRMKVQRMKGIPY